MHFLSRTLFLCYLCFFLFPLGGVSAPPQVLVSIKPIHALVAGVMKGVAWPQLLLKGTESPHTYALHPKDLKNIQDADVIFWVGPSLEEFLTKPLNNKGSKAIALMKTQGLLLLPLRFDPHHHESTYDPHIWLSPENAQQLVRAIAEKLSQIDSDHQKLYEENAQRLIHQIKTLSTELHQELKGLAEQPFLVFHDAYQYFEKTFHLNDKGAVMLNPEVSPSIHKIKELKHTIEKFHIKCIFSEPQFPSGLIQLLQKNTSVHTGLLDPLGIDLPSGEKAYFDLMRNLAQSFKKCLSF